MKCRGRTLWTLAFVIAGVSLQAPAEVRTRYVVDGLALGDRVKSRGAVYQKYQCKPSEQFASFIWCQGRRTEKGKFGDFTSVNSILHSQSGSAAYVSQYVEPAFFGAGDIEREIERLSAGFGSAPHVVKSPRRPGEPQGVIAYWGNVTLKQVDAHGLAEIAAGRSAKEGMLFDFLGNFGRSVREGFAIYQLGGGAGYVWGAHFDKSGRGGLRITAIDASQFTIPASPGSGPPALAFSIECRNATAPADKIKQCSAVISQSADPKIRERAFNRRGLAYMELKRFPEAVSDFTAVIRLNPKIAGYFDNRQNAFKGQGRLEEALADANEAVRLAPTYSFVYFGRGNIFTVMGRSNLALKDYTTAISLDPNNAGLYGGRGEIFLKIGSLREAIADFDEAIRLDPKNPAAYNRRGAAYSEEREYDRAIEDFNEAIWVDPKYAPAYSNRAVVFEKRGEFARALADYEASLVLAPGDPTVLAARDRARGHVTKPMDSDWAKRRAERRVALVIGNSAYTRADKLANPANDAAAIAALLRQVGFETAEPKLDLGLMAFKRALTDFEVAAKGADMVAIYFSGHGIQFGGQDYLLPTDAELARDVYVQDEAVPLERMLRATEGARRLRLIILDACRDNPFLSHLQKFVPTASLAKGLAPPQRLIEEKTDTLIAFAAKAGTQAIDGAPGTNSPFAAALLQRLADPGLDVMDALRLVHDDVLAATGHRQEPWTYGSLGPAQIVISKVPR